jgi:hypothetical protein
MDLESKIFKYILPQRETLHLIYLPPLFSILYYLIYIIVHITVLSAAMKVN